MRDIPPRVSEEQLPWVQVTPYHPHYLVENTREHRTASNAREHRPASNAREHRPASNAREHRLASCKGFEHGACVQ